MPLPRPAGVSFRNAQIFCLLILTVFACESELTAKDESNVFCRQGLSRKHRREVATRLQRITGWSDLDFDSNGMLRLGRAEAVGGSASARDLIAAVLDSASPIILEEANKRADIAFSQVGLASWRNENGETLQVHVVSIDFSDFEHIAGHAMARAAFDIGWVLLHEFDHIINRSTDATLIEDTGECEAYINQMRQECNLPVRAHYFFTSVPLNTSSPFVTSWVRLAFDRDPGPMGSRRRYWLVWDANLVGGTFQSKQLASVTSY